MTQDAVPRPFDGAAATLGDLPSVGQKSGMTAPSAGRPAELTPADAAQLLSALAHDVRQPLTSIRMNVQTAIRLLRERRPRVSAVIGALQDTLAAEGAAADVLLATSERVAHALGWERSVDLNAVVIEVQRQLRAATATWGQRLELELDSGRPMIDVDARRLHATVLSLVLAAFDSIDGAADQPHGTLSLTTKGKGNEHGASRFAELKLKGLPPAPRGATRDLWSQALGGAAAHAWECYTVVESSDSGVTVRVFLPASSEDASRRERRG
jgi:signal transduction histidine kinase